MLIGSFAGEPERSLLIGQRSLKVSLGFVGQPACAVQADRGCERSVARGIKRPCEVLSGGLWSIQGLRLLTGPLTIRQRLLPGPCFKEMEGQIGQVRLDARGGETF